MKQAGFEIVSATEADVPEILGLIKALAEYEKLSHMVVATEASLRAALFGERPYAEVLIARSSSSSKGEAAGFALFFHNFSTFLGKPGIYLEDLFVRPEFRRLGLGKALLKRLAQCADERGCGRIEWSVLDWNAPAIAFYERIGAAMMTDWRLMRMTAPGIEKLARE